MAYQDLYAQAREEQFLQKLTVAVVGKVRDQYVAGPGIDMASVADVLAVYAGPRSSDFRRFAEEIAAVVLVVDDSLTSDSADAEFDTAVDAVWGPYGALAAAKGLITVEVTP